MKSAQKKSSSFDKEPESQSEKPKSVSKPISLTAFSKRSLFTWGLVAVILLIAIGGGVYYFVQYQKAQQLLKNPTLGAQQESQSLITKVGTLMDLPTGEEPTIATVSDITKLKGQTFFAHAKNGDKVLIYTKAKKAILYRPSTNKIIEFGPVNLDAATASPSATLAPKQVKVILYNGTKTAGLATSVEKTLSEQVQNITVVSKGNAAKSDYTKTLVIDLTGTEKVAADQLAGVLKGEVGKLPVGETKPANVDILIILGK